MDSVGKLEASALGMGKRPPVIDVVDSAWEQQDGLQAL